MVFDIVKFGNARESLMCDLLGSSKEEKTKLINEFNKKWKVPLAKSETADKVEMMEKTFDKNDWHIEHEIDKKTNEIKIVIIRNNQDSCDIIMADGGIIRVPLGKFIDDTCGPTLRIPIKDYEEFQKHYGGK